MKLFSKAAVKAGILQVGNHREYLTQLGAGIDLVINYGWPQDQVNPADPFDWSFDVAAYSTAELDAPCVIAGEAKASLSDIDALLAGIQNCAKLGGPPDGSKAPGHQNYRGLVRFTPPYFWVISPSNRMAFRVEYGRAEVYLKQIDDIPHFDESSGAPRSPVRTRPQQEPPRRVISERAPGSPVHGSPIASLAAGTVVQAVAEGRIQARNYRVGEAEGGVPLGRELWFTGAKDDDGVCRYSRTLRRLIEVRRIRPGKSPVEGLRRSEQPPGSFLT